MTIGQNFYGDQGLTDIEDLSRRQGKQSLLYGDQAARYADPFMGERGKYQKQLSDLLADPGGYASSPVYKFAYDQGLEALNRKGSLRSGNKLAALEKYGQDMASQQYFPQAKLLSDLAMGGSSPGAAGLAYARGTERSQDQAQLSAAARAAGGMGGGSTMTSNATPWWWGGGSSGTSALPTGGASGGYSNVSGINPNDPYRGVQTYTMPSLGKDPSMMSLSELNAASGQYKYPNVGFMADKPQFDPNNPWGNGYFNGEE